MNHKTIKFIALISFIVLISACTNAVSDPLSPSLTMDPSATATIMPSATPTSTLVQPTATGTVVPATATTIPPTATDVPPTATATAQPVIPTHTPVLDWGNNWTLADVRYGVHQDVLRVVIEMTENRATIPSYDIKEVENATVPFPTGPDPSWGESRIDLVINDLYANNSPIIGKLPLVPPTNRAVTRIGQYPTFDDARLGFSIGLIKPAQFKIYELTNPVRIVIDVLYPKAEIPVTPTPVKITLDTYTNPYFAVTFKYPSHWVVDPTFGTPEYGYTSYHGDDGFFMITAAGGESLDAYTASEANHKLKPYGSNPIISNVTIQGQAARLIMPSQDQSMPEQAGLIVEYPTPVTIGAHTYPFFVMYADKDWIDCMSSTIIFEPIQ